MTRSGVRSSSAPPAGYPNDLKICIYLLHTADGRHTVTLSRRLNFRANEFILQFHLAVLDETCFTTMMHILTRFIALAAGVASLPSVSYADLRNKQQIEGACYPMAAANEALAKMAAFQATWSRVIKSHRHVVIHSESVYENGMIYQRRAPYAPWRGRAYKVVDDARRSNCHQLREEMLDGVNTVVISYTKHHPPYDPRFYRCTVWLEIPEYRNRKSDCVSVGPADVAEVKIRWFYRTDIKPPVAPPD